MKHSKQFCKLADKLDEGSDFQDVWLSFAFPKYTFLVSLIL